MPPMRGDRASDMPWCRPSSSVTYQAFIHDDHGGVHSRPVVIHHRRSKSTTNPPPLAAAAAAGAASRQIRRSSKRELISHCGCRWHHREWHGPRPCLSIDFTPSSVPKFRNTHIMGNVLRFSTFRHLDAESCWMEKRFQLESLLIQ